MMKYIFHTFSILLLLAANVCEAQVKTFKDHYKNGILKSIEHQGTYAGCGVPVGTDSLFDKQAKLVETITYIHGKDQKTDGCHGITTYVKKKGFPAGKNKPFLRFYKYGYESKPVRCNAKDYLEAAHKFMMK